MPDDNSSCRLNISIDPPTQAHMFAELELMVITTINNYLINEFEEHRLDEKSFTKLVDKWTRSGRSKPREFMFDLRTQLAIVKANLITFRFYGKYQGDYLRIGAVLAGWEVTAGNMIRRTFCHPDTEIEKYFVDILHIFELLGAPVLTFAKLQHLQYRIRCQMASP